MLAKKVSPEEIGSCTHAEILEALTELEPHIHEEWPAVLLLHVWERQATAMVQHIAKEFDEASVEQFVEFVRPYALPEDDAAILLYAPRLSHVKVSEEEKLKKYAKVMVDQLLVPMIMKGEGGKAALERLVGLIQKPLQTHLLMQLPDSVVTLTGDMLDVADTILAIVHPDPFSQLTAINAVDRVRKMFRTASGEPLSLLASALSENVYWMDKVATFAQITSSIKVHKAEIEKVNEYLASDLAASADLNEMAAKLGSIVKDLQYLSEGLSPEAVEKMMKGGAKKVVEFWHLMLAEFDKHGFQNLNVEVVQSTLVEASIAFPNEGDVQAFRGSLNEMLVLKSGEEKMTLMLQHFFKVHEAITTNSPFEEAKVSEFLEHAHAAQGVQVPMSRKEEFELALGEFPHKAVLILKRSLPDAQRFLKILKACTSWTSKTFGDTMVQRLEVVLDLALAVSDYVGDPEEKDEKKWVGQDEGKKKLTRLMSTLASAKKIGEQEWWGSVYQADKMGVARAAVERAKAHILQVSTGELQAVTDKLTPLAGGAPEGKCWTDGLKSLNDWVSLQKHAQSTLLENDAPLLNETMNQVEQVCLKRDNR